MTGDSQDQQDRRRRERRGQTKPESEGMQKLRAAMAQMNMEIPSGLRPDEIVAWALGAHLADCVIDRRENKTLLQDLKGIMDDGRGGGIAPLTRKMHGYLAPDMADDDKRKAAWEAVKKFFDTLRAVLNGRRTVMWVRIASALVITVAGVSLGPKVAQKAADFWSYISPFF